MKFFSEFLAFAVKRKKLWLLPLLLIFALMALLILSVPNNALAPLIYTLF